MKPSEAEAGVVISPGSVWARCKRARHTLDYDERKSARERESERVPSCSVYYIDTVSIPVKDRSKTNPAGCPEKGGGGC